MPTDPACLLEGPPIHNRYLYTLNKNLLFSHRIINWIHTWKKGVMTLGTWGNCKYDDAGMDKKICSITIKI